MLVLASAIALVAAPAMAASANHIVDVTLKDHKFSPDKIEVPAGKPFKIRLKNVDKSADEFDSDDLRVEKVVGGGKTSIIRVQALKPGTYKFMGEYHSATARGVVIAK
ncbi:cupredoxin domain-containing protein [Jiella sp. MQZ9-1]|nr:cupredoxin domain-containing protein [Jiella flava]